MTGGSFFLGLVLIPDSRFQIQDSGFATGESGFASQDSRVGIRDLHSGLGICDWGFKILVQCVTFFFTYFRSPGTFAPMKIGRFTEVQNVKTR